MTYLETAMGVQLNETDEVQMRYKESLREINDLAVYRTIRPWLYPNWLWFLTPMQWKERKLVKFLHNFSRKVIEERKNRFEGSVSAKIDDTAFVSKKRLAMLDLMLSAKENNGAINDEGIQEEVDTFIMEVKVQTTLYQTMQAN